MQVELSVEQIKILHGLLDEVVYIGVCEVDGVNELLELFTKQVQELDLNDYKVQEIKE